MQTWNTRVPVHGVNGWVAVRVRERPQEEAVTVTGHTDPELAARAILARPHTATQWCVVKLGAHGALLVDRTTGKAHTAPGFKVSLTRQPGKGSCSGRAPSRAAHSLSAALVRAFLALRASAVRGICYGHWLASHPAASAPPKALRARGLLYERPQVEVADTVGCGDSFAAAVVKGYLARASPEAVLTLANAVGAATATGRGAGRNVAAAAKVEQLLRGGLVAAAAAGDAARRQQLQEALGVFAAPPGGQAAAAAAGGKKQATGVA